MTALMMEINSREDAERAIHTLQQSDTGHRIPVVQAWLDGRIAHLEVQRSGCAGKTKRFLAMARLPALVLIGDDDGEDTGPDGWSVAQRLLRWARVVVLHATGAERWHYEVTIATAEAYGRVLMVECGSSTLAAWKQATLRWSPNSFVQILEVPAGRGVHPVPAAPEPMQ